MSGPNIYWQDIFKDLNYKNRPQPATPYFGLSPKNDVIIYWEVVFWDPKFFFMPQVLFPQFSIFFLENLPQCL